MTQSPDEARKAAQAMWDGMADSANSWANLSVAEQEHMTAAFLAFAARPTAGIDREAVARFLLAWDHDMDNGDWPEDSVRLGLLAVNEPHSGDCTGEPWPCLRCHAENVYKRADALIALLPAQSSERCDQPAIAEQLHGERGAVATISLQYGEDGNLRVWSEQFPGLVLSHPNAELVMADILPALRVLGWGDAIRALAGETGK